jgi:small subunit ribosomal protein S6
MRVRRYETVFVLRPDLDETEMKEVVQKLENVIAREEGTLVKKEHWGIRKLAYTVNHCSKGYYLLFDYVGPTQLIGELERHMKISENVIKFLTIKKADHIDMEAIRKEREEEERRKEEEAMRLASREGPAEEGKQETPEEEFPAPGEKDIEKLEDYDDEEDLSLEGEEEEEEEEEEK